MSSLAVVPIFVNAGAAVLPAVLAGAASAAALLLRPRALLAACRRRPWVPMLIVAAGAALWFAGAWALGDHTAQAAATAGGGYSTAPGGGFHRDWGRVALDILQREQSDKLRSATSRPASTDGQSSAPLDRPVVLGRDYSRCNFDGGLAPRGLSPAPLWKFAPEDTMFFAAPAVAGNRVYAAGTSQSVGGLSGSLVCLDADTGKQIGADFTAGDERLKPFFSSPAITKDGKSLIIGQGLHADHDCALLCFDTETHNLRWRAPTPLHIESSPAIFGDLAVAGAGAIEGPDHKATGNPGFVLGVRISDGKELWRESVNDPESSPAFDDEGNVYIGSGFNGNAVVALRSGTDEELKAKGLPRRIWSTPVSFPSTGAITVVGDLVLAGAGSSDFVFASPHPQGMVVALDRNTGKERWRQAFGDSVLGAIACRDGKLICPVRTGEVVALNLKDGTVLWRQRVSSRTPVLAGPAFTGKMVYAVSADGFLAILDAQDGHVIDKKINLNDEANPGKDNRTFASPSVSGGRVYTASETGGVRCYVGPPAE